MKKYITNLVIAVIVLLIPSIYYFGFFLPELRETEYLFNKKKECNDICKPLYDDDLYWLSNGPAKATVMAPEYTYNKDLNTCLYSSSRYADNGSTISQWVMDCLNQKEILFYMTVDGKLVRDMTLEEFEAKKYELMGDE